MSLSSHSEPKKSVALYEPFALARRRLKAVLELLGYEVEPHRTATKFNSLSARDRHIDLRLIRLSTLGASEGAILEKLASFDLGQPLHPPVLAIAPAYLSRQARTALASLGLHPLLYPESSIWDLLTVVQARVFSRFCELRRYSQSHGGLTVQLKAGETWATGTLFHLSSAGVFVQTELAEKEGCPVSVRFSFPEVSFPIDWPAVVDWVGRPDEPVSLGPRGLSLTFLPNDNPQCSLAELLPDSPLP